MPRLMPKFELERCPHCKVHLPHLSQLHSMQTATHDGKDTRYWVAYACTSCGGVVTACSREERGEAAKWYPESVALDPAVPEEVARYLRQARETLHAPDGSTMLSNSAVDAMLKLNGYKKGWLNDRITKAAADHMITDEMALWAHEIRLDSNGPRHADEELGPPNVEDAKRVLDFAETLAEILFVMPARVKSGRRTREDVVATEGGKS